MKNETNVFIESLDRIYHSCEKTASNLGTRYIGLAYISNLIILSKQNKVDDEIPEAKRIQESYFSLLDKIYGICKYNAEISGLDGVHLRFLKDIIKQAKKGIKQGA